MKIFFDLEFTGLHQKTTLVSIGMVSEDGRELYAEFSDYDRSQVTPWIRENVIGSLTWGGERSIVYTEHPRDDIPGVNDPQREQVKQGSRSDLVEVIRKWIESFGPVEFWGDCLAYDWVLFCELFEPENQDTAERLPRNVNYIPFDISTLMYLKGIDPDISRAKFYGLEQLTKHNSLDDAKVIRACYWKLETL